MAKNSLQDQLLKAGLIDKKKIKQVNKDNYKTTKQTPKGKVVVDEAKLQVEQARLAKIEKDRELNRQRQEALKQKELTEQVRQIVETHRIARAKSADTGYQSADEGKIKKIYIEPMQLEQLAKGMIAVARYGDQYELVPGKIALRIQVRAPEAIVVLNTPATQTVDEDDPYKDYVIPDDLMW